MSDVIVKTLRYFKTNRIHSSPKPILTYSRRSTCRKIKKIDSCPSKYGGKSIVTIMPGVGIGPEIMDCTLRVLESANAPLTYEILPIPPKPNMEEFENAVVSIKRNKVCLKGNIEVKDKVSNLSRNTLLRQALDTFVYVVNLKTYPGLINKFGCMNLTLIRQNTEGEYLMLEHEPTPNSVEFLKVVTVYNTERLAEFALSYAVFHKKSQVTVAHNANIHDSTEGIFIKAVQRISKKYPQVQINIVRVGVLICDIVKNPRQYDIILATNLNGSMLANFFSGMLGSPALTGGINLSQTGIAVFEPGVRNRGYSLKDKGIANPMAMIMSAVNLLEYLKYEKTADIIRASVISTLVADRIRTFDLGGKATTKDFTDGIIRNVRRHVELGTENKKKMSGLKKKKGYCPLIPDFSFTPFPHKKK